MLNKSYHVRARQMGPIGMESAGQILGQLALSALADSARRRRRSTKAKPKAPEQLELFASSAMNPQETQNMISTAPDRPLTEDELFQEFNRLFPEKPCPR